MFETELKISVQALGPGVRLWLRRALSSGWYPLGSGSYEGGPGGAMCPVAAAAKMAGIWSNGAIASGNPDWGDPDAPSPEVEDFAAYFDLCAEDNGVGQAIELVRLALEQQVASQLRVA